MVKYELHYFIKNMFLNICFDIANTDSNKLVSIISSSFRQWSTGVGCFCNWDVTAVFSLTNPSSCMTSKLVCWNECKYWRHTLGEGSKQMQLRYGWMNNRFPICCISNSIHWRWTDVLLIVLEFSAQCIFPWSTIIVQIRRIKTVLIHMLARKCIHAFAFRCICSTLSLWYWNSNSGWYVKI